jgi:hypothetical protein
MDWRITLVALISVAWAPSALAQTREEFTFERVIRLGVGDVTKAQGPIERGDVVLSFPYEYRRTGVLQNDVRGTGVFALRTLYAAVGTPGFMLGEFSTGGSGRGSQVWCFQRPATEEPERAERIVCFLGAWPLNFIRPPLLISSFSINPSHHNTSDIPVVEEGTVTLPFDLRLEFRMRAWNRRFLQLDLYADGERINTFSVPRAADGSATLPSVAGSIRFVQAGGATTATPLDEPGPSTDLADLMRRSGLAGAGVVESPLIVVAPPETTGAYITAARNDEIMRQQVRAPAPIQIDAAPNGNAERFGDAGTLLYPAMRGNFLIYCRPPPPRALGELLRTRLYCLEDSDGDHAFDAMWSGVSHADVNGVFVISVSPPAQRLRDSVPFSEVLADVQPEMAVRLRYRGPSGDRRNEGGEVVATGVNFSWVLAENVGDLGPAFDFQVSLDEDGEGQIVTPTGVSLGRVRNVNVATGAAEIMIEGGLPAGETTYLSGRTGMVARAPSR